MNRFALALCSVVLSTGAVAADGEAIFLENGCASCHKPEAESSGPPLSRIAAAYSGRRTRLIEFFAGGVDPSVEPKRFDVMRPHLSKTELLGEEERGALADYVLNPRSRD